MQANRPKDTAPEVALRQALFVRGLRYRVNRRPLQGLNRTADVVFPRQRLAVFVDGCFWHGCDLHYRAPKSHVDYWQSKVEQNRARDIETTRLLEAAGWTVLRYSSHQSVSVAADEIAELISGGTRKALRPR